MCAVMPLVHPLSELEVEQQRAAQDLTAPLGPDAALPSGPVSNSLTPGSACREAFIVSRIMMLLRAFTPLIRPTHTSL